MNFLNKFLQLRKLRRYKDNINFQQKIWLQLKPIKLRENKLEQEKKEIQEEKQKIKFPSWGKILLVFLFLNFTILEIFIGWVTIQSLALAFTIGTMVDFTPLVTLIGLVTGETISYGIYCAKSKAENTKNGIIYDLAILEKQNMYNNNEDDSVG